tara:strand:+ start:277 stop:1032 length:756 start_codon:yes stop_codon:yes gene_type:complete
MVHQPYSVNGEGLMGIERLPGAKKKLKATRKNRNQPFAVRLTPFGSKTHLRIGTMNAECSGISIAESSDGMVFFDYEQLLARREIGDGTSLIRISEEDASKLQLMIEQEIARHPRLAKRKARRKQTNVEAKRLEHEVEELQKHNQKLQRQLNNDAGTLIELQLTGIVPLGEKPPIPLKRIQQMKYGCDWLSMAFNRNTLHLYFIESNLSRNRKKPTLNKNERRLRKAILEKKVITHYTHHWVDQDGKIHWD